MALINCPECGREISDKASACPHCGYPISSQDTVSSNCASIRVLCKTSSLQIDGHTAQYGNIVKIDVGTEGKKKIRIQAFGGDVGLFGSGIEEIVIANQKYDLSVYNAILLGRMLRLQKVGEFLW